MHKFEVDDQCWIRLAGQQGIHPGVVVLRFQDDSVTHPFYLIRMDNFTWPQYEVRDATLMGKSADDAVPLQTAFKPGWQRPSAQ